ncbi:MAG: efflux RND transporter periplasmic adaptor subunit [Magnetococcales bacterium]|nr:efflux RND transporter periplasmic adaptor subunit [Magnetococcales bacterium]MBF0322804.1 efflux RND transporter periplasmic adaptor subunit [Magnetococcales bacterium]
MPPPEVDVFTVRAGEVTLTRDLPGRLQAWRTAEVRARVEGIIEKRLFAEGSDVRVGETLFQIDARAYQAAYEAATADVEAARLVVERHKSLLGIKAVSRQEFDAAQARLKQTQAALTRAKLDLENTRVPAPIAGRVGRTLVTEGALVGRGEATHLATIEQLDPIYANFSQPGAEMQLLRAASKAGQSGETQAAKVELLLGDGGLHEQAGQVVFADMAVDPSTGAVSLRARFPNPERTLLPGMFVRVRLVTSFTHVIRVPQRAVQGGQQGQSVRIVSADGKVAPQPVKTRGMVDGDFIISEGLKGGEQVIVNGWQKAPPGTTVKPVSWPPEMASGFSPPSVTTPTPKTGE